MGQVIQAGAGQAPARQAALKGGLPEGVSATTINKVCGSGMKAVMLGAASIRAGDADVIVAGGMENMNLGPYLLPGARAGYRLGNPTLVDSTVHDGLWCATCDVHMGDARRAGGQEARRHARGPGRVRAALASAGAGRHGGGALPRRDRAGDGGRQEGPDHASIPTRTPAPTPRWRRWPASSPPSSRTGGTVTAGNAPGITDGAAALVIASEAVVDADGLEPMARITGYAQADVAPEWLFEAPIHGVKRLIERVGGSLDDFDLIEINEAFAAQVLADGNALGFDWDRVNVNGGAIALGHPIGASGARVLTTLLYELRRRGGRQGPGDPVPGRRRGGGHGGRGRLPNRPLGRQRPPL